MNDYIYIYNSGFAPGVLDRVMDANLSERLSGELTFSFLTKVGRLPAITAATEIVFRGQYYRAVQVQSGTADGAFTVSVSCEQESTALVDDELELFDYEGSADGALSELLSGTGITATAEHTETIHVRKEHTNRRAVLTEICGICGAEMEYDGHAIRLVRRRGTGSGVVRNLADLMPWTDFSETVDLRDGSVSYEVAGADPGKLVLGETVRVVSSRLGISAEKRIVGISYNPFDCRTVQVEIGDFVPDILDSYREAAEESADALDKAESALDKAESAVQKGELSAAIDTYVNEEAGRASIVAALKGTYVTSDDLTGYTKKTELSAEIGAYIDTESGTAKIIDRLKGTYVTSDALGKYVEKTTLSTEIGSYIDTAAGTAKVVTAASGTFQKKSDMSGYVTTTTLNTSISQYINGASGQAAIVSAISGEYAKKSDLTGYATKTSVTSEIAQSVSPLESKISLSAAYGSGTIGSNVRALLTLVSNPDSSSIRLSADAISLVGTVYMKSSDYVASGTTMIKGSKIQTSDLYIQQLRATNGDYIIDYYGSTLAIGGATGVTTGSFAYFNYVDIMVTNSIRIGRTSADIEFVCAGGEVTLKAYSSNKIFRIGNSTYPVDTIYCDALYVNGKSVTGSGSSSDSSLKATDVKAVYASGSTSNSVTLNSSNYFVPGNSSAYYLGSTSYPFRGLYLGTSSYYWVMDANGIIPNYATTSYFNIGSSAKPVSTIYAKSIYLNGTALSASGSGSGSTTSADFTGKNVKLGGNTSYYIQANTSRQFCPNTSSTSYPFYLGTLSYYWHYAYIGSVETHIGDDQYSKLGFFGKTAVTRQTVSNSATVATLITALKAYGLIY